MEETIEKSLLYPAASKTRRVVSLDGMWRFCFDEESQGEEKGWAKGLVDTVSMPVPSSFADLFTDKDSREYTGDFWYETEFVVPGEWEGKEIVIRFGSATHRAKVFVNGVEVAQHIGGFLPFNAVVTEHVHFDSKNRLTVLLNNELSETMIPCGKTITLPNGKKMVQPYFDFYNYSGLQRPVKLLAIPKESVQNYETSYEIPGDGAAKVCYHVITNGTHPVEVSLSDAQGKTVAKELAKASEQGFEGVLTVSDVKLWDVHNAYLYTMTIRILDGETVLDEYTEKIGIRTFEIKDEKFLLNGKPVYLRGFGKHEDADIRGRGLDLVTVKRDFECMKWIGANCFRTSHYPYAEELYQMADEEGFLVIDEVPAVGMFESLMNAVDAANGAKGAVHWFKKETTPQLLEHHLECIREMITRDHNHPSVIAWSLLNEPETIHESAVPYFEKVFAYAHELDMQMRPCTFALVMNSKPDTCKCWQLCDFVSLNRYYGWYVMGGYQMSRAEELFRQELDAWGKIRGNKPFLFTEYGADTDGALHKLPSVMWSQEYQDEYLDMTHRVFDSYPWILGELAWNFADFQTGEGIIRLNGNKKGIFTRDRQPKSAAYVFKNRWESLPVDYK